MLFENLIPKSNYVAVYLKEFFSKEKARQEIDSDDNLVFPIKLSWKDRIVSFSE